MQDQLQSLTRPYSRCSSPPCDSQSVHEAGRHDGAEMQTETQERCCLRKVTGHSWLSWEWTLMPRHPPGSPFLSSLHNEPTHLSSAPRKEPVVYCMTLKLEYSFQVQGSKKHAQRTNPLKMQMPLTLISNIYTHTFTHANERDARQGLSLQHPAHDNHVRDTSSSGVRWPSPTPPHQTWSFPVRSHGWPAWSFRSQSIIRVQVSL